MKTKTSHSLNSSNSFSGTFSIYALLKNVGKTLRTLQNPSESPNYSSLRAEELKPNPSNPSGSSNGCKTKPKKAQSYGCGGCGGKVYTQAEIWVSYMLPEDADWEQEHSLVMGWKCDKCGSEFQYIGGSKGPLLIN